VLQRAAVCCSVLRCITACCSGYNVLQFVALNHLCSTWLIKTMQRGANVVLQCAAVCGSVSQCVAV